MIFIHNSFRTHDIPFHLWKDYKFMLKKTATEVERDL